MNALKLLNELAWNKLRANSSMPDYAHPTDLNTGHSKITPDSLKIMKVKNASRR